MNARLALSVWFVAVVSAIACGDLVGATAGSDEPRPGDGGSPDVLPSQSCPAGCLPPAPEGWVGPSSVFDDVVAPEAGLPPCPDVYPQPEERAWRDLDAGPASCSCGLGAIKGATCQFDVVSEDTGCMNMIGSTTTFVGSGAAVSCFSVSTAAYMVTTPVLVEAGTCAFDMQATIKPDAVFTRGAAACGTATALPACAGRADCLQPSAAGAPFGRFCVHKAGDVACPSDDYAARFVAYRSMVDERACTPCVGSTSAVHCPTSYGVAATCPAAAGSSRTVTECVNVDGTNNMVVTSDLRPSPSACAQTDGGTPTGDAHGTDPVTFCCSR